MVLFWIITRLGKSFIFSNHNKLVGIWPRFISMQLINFVFCSKWRSILSLNYQVCSSTKVELPKTNLSQNPDRPIQGKTQPESSSISVQLSSGFLLCSSYRLSRDAWSRRCLRHFASRIRRRRAATLSSSRDSKTWFRRRRKPRSWYWQRRLRCWSGRGLEPDWLKIFFLRFLLKC